MSPINKQKFLAELAKLLTFMYEEDRQLALEAYHQLFEEAEDEQLLLQSLNSPLRQAVEVARAYNSSGTGLDGGSAPSADRAYMETIARIREAAMALQPVKEAPAEEPVPPEEPAEFNEQISLFDETAGEEPEAPAEEAPGEEPAEPREPEAEAPVSPAGEPEPEAPAEDRPPEPEEKPARVPVQKTLRKPRVLLLILYSLIAVPLGLVLALILLVPALLSLAAAGVCLTVAVMGISAAVTSFPVISNLLVALGAALILLAVGLVFLMLFIWFLGGAIGGMINGLITLGGKWCYKEVPAA